MEAKEKDHQTVLISLIKNCPEIIETLEVCRAYGLKDYYLAGGAITQLIWNNLLGNTNLHNVKDFDIVYYSKEEKRGIEKAHEDQIKKLVKHNTPLDIVNQAYVHEWYPEKFGNAMMPLLRTEDGIKTWLSAFAIGIRKSKEYEVFAPYGLNDAFGRIVRPNKLTMSKENYIAMTDSFKKRWPQISILPW